jgi:hypothetical protein
MLISGIRFEPIIALQAVQDSPRRRLQGHCGCTSPLEISPFFLTTSDPP